MNAPLPLVKQLLIPCIGGLLAGKMIVDLFAGIGGASIGIEKALGRSPDVACNHCRQKIGVHSLNHPGTLHLCDDVRQLKPLDVCKGWPLGLLWLSPDCRHFSRAKGATPVSDSVRSLAWEAVTWAGQAMPDVISLENVCEFLTWGPLIPKLDKFGNPMRYTKGENKGKVMMVPDPARRGETFRQWVRALEDAGYVVGWRVLCAADYGTPTIRKRLFIQARRDGRPISWPEATHGPGLKPYRTAGECIDWTTPCKSIFDRKKPLADNSCRRLARGVLRYVIKAAKPYIVRIGQQGGRGDYVQGTDRPLTTIVTKAEHCLVTPSLVSLRGTEDSHQHGDDINAPLRTISAGGSHHAVIAGSLTKYFSSKDGKQDHAASLDDPLPTVTQVDHNGLVAAHLVKTAGCLVQYYSQGTTAQACDQPLHTVVTKARHAAVEASLSRDLAGATRTAYWLMHYLGHEVPVRWVEIDGVPEPVVVVVVDGDEYLLTDLGLRMLQPRELARAQGFPETYVLQGSKRAQIAGIGNSVCPPLAEALIRAIFGFDRPATDSGHHRMAA